MSLLIRLTLLILISLSIINTERTFFKRNEHKITAVNILGPDRTFNKELEFLKTNLVGQSLYKIDLARLKTLLNKDIRLESVTVNATGLNTLNIYVERKKPKYYLQYKNKTFLIDKNNIVYGELKDEKITSLPFILINKNSEIPLLLNIMENIENIFNENISQIYLEDDNCIKVVLINGTTLKTNLDVTQDKYYIVKNLSFGLSKVQKVEYIDLRFEDYIVKYLEEENEK